MLHKIRSSVLHCISGYHESIKAVCFVEVIKVCCNCGEVHKKFEGSHICKSQSFIIELLNPFFIDGCNDDVSGCTQYYTVGFVFFYFDLVLSNLSFAFMTRCGVVNYGWIQPWIVWSCPLCVPSWDLSVFRVAYDHAKMSMITSTIGCFDLTDNGSSSCSMSQIFSILGCPSIFVTCLSLSLVSAHVRS